MFVLLCLCYITKKLKVVCTLVVRKRQLWWSILFTTEAGCHGKGLLVELNTCQIWFLEMPLTSSNPWWMCTSTSIDNGMHIMFWWFYMNSLFIRIVILRILKGPPKPKSYSWNFKLYFRAFFFYGNELVITLLTTTISALLENKTPGKRETSVC